MGASDNLGIPVIALVAAIVFFAEWILKKTLCQFSPKAYHIFKVGGEWFTRVYIVCALVMVIPWIIGMIWLGVYQYPNAAERAGAERHNWLVAKMTRQCRDCPMWSNNIRGIAIVSNGTTDLIATPTGVQAIRAEGLTQNFSRPSQ